jgi:hypothetical protein
MRSVYLRGVLVLSALGLGTGVMGCQRHEGEEGPARYEEQGGANLPEGTRGGHDQGAQINVETGKRDGRQEAPGKQQENRYQAGADQPSELKTKG